MPRGSSWGKTARKAKPRPSAKDLLQVEAERVAQAQRELKRDFERRERLRKRRRKEAERKEPATKDGF